MNLGQATWTEVEAAGRRAVVIPLGSCEQHGPHLPFGTDTLIATALAEALAVARPDDVVVAPPVGISASGEHAGFPGTLSIGSDVLVDVLVELGRSADWATGLVIVNGHGGNADAVTRAAARLTAEGRRLLVWWPPRPAHPRADAHAGWTETSLMLHLAPGLVRVSAAAPGDTRPLSAIAGELRRGGVQSVSANGVLGDPTGASATHGARAFEQLATDLVARFDEWLR